MREASKHLIGRKDFLKIGVGATAAVLIQQMSASARTKFLPALAGGGPDPSGAELWRLDADPPEGTRAVRYFVDEMQVSELTDLYGRQTGLKPSWETFTDPGWLGAGRHEFRIEADTPDGTKTIGRRKIRVSQEPVPPGRIRLGGKWKFAAAGDLPEGAAEGGLPSAVAPGFSAGRWKDILVPGSLGYTSQKWNIDQGILGVYRRTVSLKAPADGERVILVFPSVYWNARVFVNGQEVGGAKGGYLPLRCDITREIKPGNNEVAVMTDNRLSSMGALKRVHEFYWNWGGILQEPHLEYVPGRAFMDIQALGSASGTLRVWVTALNATDAPVKLEGKLEVFDAAGKRILGAQPIEAAVPANAFEYHAAPVEFRVSGIKPWKLEHPVLYRVKVSGPWGMIERRTGFRDVKVSGPDLFINGKKITDLQGFDRHADYPGLGRTQPPGLAFREMKELHDKGFRIFRPAHYPTTPAQLDAADSLGMLVIEEINVTGLKGEYLATNEIREYATGQLTKMIRRDRSHPCVIAWSVGNENLTDEQGAVDYVRDMIKLGRSLDPSRLFVHVTMRATKDKSFAYQDFVAQNYYDVHTISDMVDQLRVYAGNKPVLISEYGVEAVAGRPGLSNGTEFYQAYYVDLHNKLLNGRDHLIGKMYWTSTEFWCNPTWSGGNPRPVPPFHMKGLVGYQRDVKKLAWRVMFSPVRLSLGEGQLVPTAFGGELQAKGEAKTTAAHQIVVQEVRGLGARGILKIQAPAGFAVTEREIHFQVAPYGKATFEVRWQGMIPAASDPAPVFIRAVIDEDTEALPLALSVKRMA